MQRWHARTEIQVRKLDRESESRDPRVIGVRRSRAGPKQAMFPALSWWSRAIKGRVELRARDS
jgi:hypothetical protein